MALAASHLAPVSLELGGKGAKTVFDDANLDHAVHWAVEAIFRNAGRKVLPGPAIPSRGRPGPDYRARMGSAAPLASLALALVVLAGCGGDEERPRAADDPSSAQADAEEIKGVDGTLAGDPGSIRPFVNPQAEIASDGDLVDYLLPGLSGTGVDCLEDDIDVEDILSSSVQEGATATVALILDCVATEETAEIFTMYAVGFEEDGRDRYADLASCVADGFGTLGRDDLEGPLENVYIERLDLLGPPTSRQVAAEELERLTPCSATREPPREETEPPRETEPPPQNRRVVQWTALSPGDCLVGLPAGKVEQVVVVDCRVPHRYEVVGGTFAGTNPGPVEQCKNLYEHYTGRKFARSSHRLDYLTAAPGSVTVRLVCLASEGDGRKRRGSIR